MQEPRPVHWAAAEGAAGVTTEPADEHAAEREEASGGCCSGYFPKPWLDQDIPTSVRDLHFVIYTLNRKNKEFARYRDLLVYLVFMCVFTYTLLTGKGLTHGFFTVSGVGGVVAGGEWNQGPATQLYFQKTFDDIGQTSDFWQWVVSDQSMLSLFGLANNSIQGQNHVLHIIRIRQQRVRQRSSCDSAAEYLHGNWSGWFRCYPDYSSGNKDTSPIAPAGVNTSVCGRDRMDRSPFEYNTVRQVWPSNSGGVQVKGQDISYPIDGYFFDVYADMQSAEFVNTMNCLQNNNWIDAVKTRLIEIQFFTYNPETNIFLEVRLLTEISAAGLFRTISRHNVFKMFRPQGFSAAMEIALFVGIVYYCCKLLFEIYHSVRTTRRVFLWCFSVWRLVEIMNMCIFLYVAYMKLTYFLMPRLELKFHPEHTHSNVRDHADLQKYGEEFFYDAVFARLEDYSSHMRNVVLFSAFNGCLSFLKLFKYLSLSPYFNLLTETIKASVGSLISLLFYLFIITNAFAVMGLIIFGTQVERYSHYSRCLRSLFISLLGDFDYDELLMVNPDYVDIFFFGYQILTWLILINMVISIISEGFDRAKQRQASAVGETPLAVTMRETWGWIEDQVTGLCCRGRGRGAKPRVASAVRWNQMAGVSIGDVAEALRHGTDKARWLQLHCAAEPLQEARQTPAGGWAAHDAFVADHGEQAWAEAGWELSGRPPACACSDGVVVLRYPETSQSVVAELLKVSGIGARGSRAAEQVVLDVTRLLCWYFDPANITRDTVYQAWVFYNEIEVPRMQFVSTDARGAKPFQLAYLKRTQEDGECTPLLQSPSGHNDSSPTMERQTTMRQQSVRQLLGGPKPEGTDGGDLQKLLAMIEKQDTMLAELVKEAERDRSAPEARAKESDRVTVTPGPPASGRQSASILRSTPTPSVPKTRAPEASTREPFAPRLQTQGPHSPAYLSDCASTVTDSDDTGYGPTPSAARSTVAATRSSPYVRHANVSVADFETASPSTQTSVSRRHLSY